MCHVRSCFPLTVYFKLNTHNYYFILYYVKITGERDPVKQCQMNFGNSVEIVNELTLAVDKEALLYMRETKSFVLPEPITFKNLKWCENTGKY